MSAKALSCVLIDDDADDREIFSIALGRISGNILLKTAADGQEGLHLLKLSEVPDFIFLDLNMPRFNGRQCLTEIRKIPTHLDVPVVIYTTSFQQHDKEELLSMGASHFISKPSDIDRLTTLLSTFFEQAAHHRIQKQTIHNL